MTIIRRVLSVALGARVSARLPESGATSPDEALSLPYGRSGRIISSPWEGMYVEGNSTSPSQASEPQQHR